MNTQGFYKKIDNSIIFGGNIIEGNNYSLNLENYTTYEYPVDGWIYAANIEAAASIFSLATNTVPPFLVESLGIYLATDKSDETEFNKLITLLQLSLERRAISNDTVIRITDKDGTAHGITVSNFLNIMVAYGMHCYTYRSL